jgi:hypothetical protein
MQHRTETIIFHRRRKKLKIRSCFQRDGWISYSEVKSAHLAKRLALSRHRCYKTAYVVFQREDISNEVTMRTYLWVKISRCVIIKFQI